MQLVGVLPQHAPHLGGAGVHAQADGGIELRDDLILDVEHLHARFGLAEKRGVDLGTGSGCERILRMMHGALHGLHHHHARAHRGGHQAKHAGDEEPRGPTAVAYQQQAQARGGQRHSYDGPKEDGGHGAKVR